MKEKPLAILPRRMGRGELRQIRRAMQLRQRELARLLCHSLAAVQAWEQGDRQVPQLEGEVLRDIAAGRYTPRWAVDLLGRR